MLGLFALFILAYGPLNWAFPWWLWILGVIIALIDTGHRTRQIVKKQLIVQAPGPMYR